MKAFIETGDKVYTINVAHITHVEHREGYSDTNDHINVYMSNGHIIRIYNKADKELISKAIYMSSAVYQGEKNE